MALRGGRNRSPDDAGHRHRSTMRRARPRSLRSHRRALRHGRPRRRDGDGRQGARLGACRVRPGLRRGGSCGARGQHGRQAGSDSDGAGLPRRSMGAGGRGCAGGCPIKDHVNGDARICHTPWSPWYGRVRMDVEAGSGGSATRPRGRRRAGGRRGRGRGSGHGPGGRPWRWRTGCGACGQRSDRSSSKASARIGRHNAIYASR